MKQFFIESFQNILHKYIPYLKRDRLSQNDIKILSEFSFLLLDIISKLEFSSYDKVLLERLLVKYNNLLYSKARIFYYSSFHYLPSKFFDGKPEEISKATFKVNIDINIMRLQIKSGSVTGSSEDEYFFSRGKNDLLRAMKNLVTYGKDENEIFIPAFYTLLNYHQAIMEYLESDNKTYEMEAEKIIEEINSIINLFFKKSSIKNRIEIDYQLKLFLENEVKRYKIWKKENYDYKRINIKGFKVYKNISKKNWAFLSLYNINSEEFCNQFEIDFRNMYENQLDKLKDIEQIILLRNCVNFFFWIKDNKIDKLNIPVFEKFNSNNWFKLSDYFNGYEQINSILVTDEDRKKIESWDDNELRKKVGKTIINIDPNIIAKECSKPHGVYEIADMELPIKNKDNYNTYYLCMPFKSGKEIKGKVKEDLTYQVFRPYTYFGERAIVVFISVKEATEPFYNSIKRAKANLNWEVHTIIGDTLIKLLKYNSLI